MTSPNPKQHSSNEMRDLRIIQSSLKAFASSPQEIKILHTLPHAPLKYSSTKPPKELYVLDSSFNPPTRAHFRLCTSALLNDRSKSGPKRLLLLLATQNADKAPKPAAFEHRLAMMSIFAEEMANEMAANGDGEGVLVDVGVTKKARFVDKARAIEECEVYALNDDGGENVEQVHLTGFDTLIRLLDTKYYPPDYTLAPLEGLFEKHRVRVTRRTGDAWGGCEEQDEYMTKLRSGEMGDQGGRKEWAERIELVEGTKEGEEIISSTKVREASRKSDEVAMMKLVTKGVGRWILDSDLYFD